MPSENINPGNVLHKILSFSIMLCLVQMSFGQSSVQPVTVVQSADRVSLFPFKNQPDNQNFVYPTVIRKNGNLSIFTSRQFDILEMISGNGVLVFQENIKGRTGRFDVTLRSASSGINYVRLRNKETMVIQKVVVAQ